MSNINVDVLIIGAGPSGCVAASYLHNNGLKIKVVEKNNFPRFVIGESLLPRCMDHFEEVGLLDCLKKKEFEVVILVKNTPKVGIGHGKCHEQILIKL